MTDSSSTSPHRLVTFLTALGACASTAQLRRIAASLAAEELDAEVGVLIAQGVVKAAVGFGDGPVPVDALLGVPQGIGTVGIPGLGVCHAMATAWSPNQSGRLVVARLSIPFNSHERDLLLGMAGAFAMAADSLTALEHGHTQLKTLEVLLSIQRSISHREPLPDILTAITDGASSVLGGCPVSLVLDDALDPQHPVHAGASIGSRPETFVAAVHIQGNPAGHLSATTANGEPLDAEDRALLCSFAEHASLALTDARTVEAMHEAFHDPLTALPNRLLFLDTLTEALTSHPDGSVAVLFVDLDRFKAVNDTLGHAAGDELLIQVGERLRAARRAVSSAARFGGDEFAVLVIHGGDHQVALDVADQVIATLAEPFLVRGKTVIVGATVGISHSGEGRSATELLADADLAMYRGKAAGGGRSATFDPQMRRDLVARLDLEAELSGALARDEFAVVFQPIVDLVTGLTVAMEALLRWHPTRGYVPPSDVIPIAEANGLIVPIGRWVLGQALHWAAMWRQEVPDLRISVNVSVHQLRERGFAAEVVRALEFEGLPPEALIIEVTESALIADHDETIGALKDLATSGIAIALDDFGTGYSSLSYLQRFPVHILKIDRSFVSGEANAKSNRLVQTVMGLGRAYELEVIAEGIENERQLQSLLKRGCRLGQGYYLGSPSEPGPILGTLGGNASGADAIRPSPARARPGGSQRE